MIKWIGQHIVDFIARFRSDVYLEDIADGTVVDNKFLGLDSNNKVVKEAASATVTDLHSAGVDGADNQLLTDKGDGTITSEANATYDGADLTLTSGTSAKPVLTLKNTNTTNTSNSELKFLKDAADVESGEYIGSIGWYGDNDNASPETIQYAKIFSRIGVVTDGSERGNLHLNVAEYDGTLTTGLLLEGQDQDGEVDVNIAAGAGSTTTIAGNLALSGNTITSAADLNIVATGNDIAVDTDNFTISSAASVKPSLVLRSTQDANKPSQLKFLKERSSTHGADADFIGLTQYVAGNTPAEPTLFASTTGSIRIAADGVEEGSYAIDVKNTTHTSNLQNGLLIASNGAVNDVTLGHGTASVTTAAGNMVVTTRLTASDQFAIGGHVVDDIDLAGEFVDSDNHLMTSAAIDDRIAAAAGGVTADPFTATVIKILPHQFICNDDVGRPAMIEDDTSNTLGIRAAHASMELYAFQKIPAGYKATHVQVHASASTAHALKARSFNYQTGADNNVSETDGAFNTNTNITDIPSSATQDLVIKVAPASISTIIYGATVTIATI